MTAPVLSRNVNRGVELGYAERTSDFTTTTTNSHVDVTSLSITVTVGTRPIKLMVFAPVLSHSAAGNHFAFIREGTTDIAYAQRSGRSTGEIGELNISRRLAPSAGEHTYKVTVYNFAAGTVTFGGAATAPSYIQAVEV